jgi:glyoxylase-like metal-dependent hydrolase (beta-lactamase superfamily II)
VRRAQVGEIELLVIEDGICSYEPGFLLAPFHGVPNERLPTDVRADLDDGGFLQIPYNPTLIRTPTAMILIDAGAGPEVAEEWEEPVGRAAGSLEAAGVGRDAIDVAVITHGHPDHLPGFTELIDGERVPTFPDTRHLISDAEWRYWMDREPSGPSAGMVPSVRPHLTALRDAGVLELVDGDEEVAEGVTLLATPGHTPGHLCVEVASRDDVAVVCGDVVLSRWAFDHPEWVALGDVDGAMAVASRRALFDRLVTDGGLLMAFHLAEPGRVRSAGDAYAFAPE